MRYLDPKNDLTFKKIFGQNPHLLISFLNGIMPFEKDEFIVSIEYLNNELVPLLPNLKHSVVDVRCVDNYDRHIIIEVQLVFSDSFYNRVLFNAAKVYTHQLSRGEKYIGLLPVYSINIIDDNMGFEGNEYYHHYSIIDKKYPNRKLNGIEFLFIELPKFDPTFSEKRLGVLWLKFLSQIENKTEMIPQELMEVPEIAEAISLLEESSYTKQELEQYDKYWDIISTQKSFIYDAEIRGEKRGEKLGEKRGELIGEKKTKLKLAKNLKKLGKLSEADIASVTGLTLEEIIKLK